MDFVNGFAIIVFGVMAVALVGMLGVVLEPRLKLRRVQREADIISATIRDYFLKNGVKVSVACVRLPAATGYTVVVESEPMKRFRLSHLIELTLIDHVAKTCGLGLVEVYWRFPIRKIADSAPAAGASGKENGDDDFEADPMAHKPAVAYDVMEVTWETFEEAQSSGRG
jgi:hypothetical protein